MDKGLEDKFRSNDCNLIILDLGGASTGLSFSRYVERPNTEVVAVHVTRTPPTDFDFNLADGRALPIRHNSVDYVFSDEVVRRTKFAYEIIRVCKKRFFVATPNYFFPLEPHTFIPLFQFFPIRFQRLLMRDKERIDLLTESQLSSLFPNSIVHGIGLYLPFAETLVCTGEVSLQPCMSAAT